MLELGCGNIICVMAASIVLYIFFEYPFRRIIDFTLLPFVSHDEVLHLGFVRRQVNSAATGKKINEPETPHPQ